jgi:two-component system, NtrC family, response regulator AtoC
LAAAAIQRLHVHEMDAIIASPCMHELVAVVDRVAAGNASVLITGETGTGKELIARAIHARSLRASKSWVDINCGALPEHLVESELFGYDKGAFSGADTSKPGLFELAHNGTLFLDEVGELEPKVQVKLLRVLDGVPYYRLGGSRRVTVDVRVIAATNRPLEMAVKNGSFRQDLYHRLCQLHLRVPPLRERPEDIVVLASHFLEQNCSGKQLSFGALEIFRDYSWPGNVRELRNVILQAALNARGAEIAPEDLPPEIAAPNVASQQRTALEAPPAVDLEELEKQAITRALILTAGHQGLAAEQLGISRRTLSRRLKQFRIDRRSAGKTDDSGVQVFRASIDTPVHIVSKHGQQSATSVNVSEGGIAVEGIRDPLQLTGTLKIEFMIPGESETFTASAQIVWADVQGRAGFRFTQVASDARSSLIHWLRKKRSELSD